MRQAYLARAREHHPDHQDGHDVEGRAQADRRMQQVNGAWAVLGDRDARAVYDAELGIVRDGGDPDVVPLAETPTDLRALVRRFLPLLIVLGLLAAFLVLTAYAGPAPS